MLLFFLVKIVNLYLLFKQIYNLRMNLQNRFVLNIILKISFRYTFLPKFSKSIKQVLHFNLLIFTDLYKEKLVIR